MEEIELIYYILGSLTYTLLIGGILWFIINLFCVRCYEIKINKLYQELKIKIDQEKNRLASMQAIERRIENLKESYESKIEELERNRKFILDKLPFIK